MGSALSTRVGCLVKWPLGCLGFFAGLVAVAALFLPQIVGHLGARLVEDEFNEAHHGRLEIGRTEFSWWNDSELSSVVLRDPDHMEVISARVEMPPFDEIFDETVDGIAGSFRARLSARITEEDGRTNLGRALERRPGAKGSGGVTLGRTGFDVRQSERSGATIQIERAFRLSLECPRLSWTGPERVLECLDARGELVAPADGEARLTMGGGIAGEPRARWTLELVVADRRSLFHLQAVPPRVSLELRASDVPSALLAGWIDPAALPPELGPRLSTLTLRGEDLGADPARPTRPTRIDLQLAWDETSHEVALVWRGGILVAAEQQH